MPALPLVVFIAAVVMARGMSFAMSMLLREEAAEREAARRAAEEAMRIAQHQRELRQGMAALIAMSKKSNKVGAIMQKNNWPWRVASHYIASVIDRRFC